LNGDCGLLDVWTCERDGALLRDLELPAALLPPLASSGEIIGEITAAAAEMTGLARGTPVVIAGSDTQVALYGMGVEEPGDVGIAAGWSCPLQIVTDAPRLDAQKRTWVCVHVAPERWTVESSATDAGRIWRWWCETLCGSDIDAASGLAAASSPGAGGLSALLGPRRMNTSMMGPYIGGMIAMTPINTEALGRGDLLRAVLENIAYALRANLEQAGQVAGIAAMRIVMGGGLTRATTLPSAVASVFNRPIDVADEIEVTGWGAARVAARARDIDLPPVPTTRIEPVGADVETYDRLYERWRKIGEKLDGMREEVW
jgi:sugar (pentulose or hexulose) kinase